MLFRSERARIDSSGNLGIGTNNPNQLLQVGAASTQAFVVTSSGFIGIGTTNPGRGLDIYGDGNAGGGATYNYLRVFTTNTTGYGPGLIVNATSISGARSYAITAAGTSDNAPVGSFLINDNSSNTPRFVISGIGSVGIATTNPSYTLQVNGSFAATTKSFVIPHPTKENYKLRYACLEGPENSIFVRGRTTQGIIELPEYWTNLVDENSITVHLTPIGNKTVWVEEINNNKVYINSDDTIDCFYTVFAERKDVEKLVVEVEGN